MAIERYIKTRFQSKILCNNWLGSFRIVKKFKPKTHMEIIWSLSQLLVVDPRL